MTEPSVRTTVVGSYPTPAWLAAMPSTPALRDALLVVLKTQEAAGLDVISDGELSRFDVNHPETNGMIDAFVRPLDGVDTDLSRSELQRFRADPDMGFRLRPSGVVSGPIGEGRLNLPEDWERVRGLAARPLRFTVTSPYMLAKTLLDNYYGSRRDLSLAIAEVLAEQVRLIDARVIQVDEAHLTGHPEDVEWAHEPINLILDAAHGERAVHLCFGNYGGATVQRGFWQSLLPFFNRLHADHLVLELARRDDRELEVFRDLREDIALGVGVVDIKDNEAESPDCVARRIEKAVRTLGPERVRWVHPDCGLWMLHRSVADRKLRALAEGRDRFTGAA